MQSSPFKAAAAAAAAAAATAASSSISLITEAVDANLFFEFPHTLTLLHIFYNQTLVVNTPSNFQNPVLDPNLERLVNKYNKGSILLSNL